MAKKTQTVTKSKPRRKSTITAAGAGAARAFSIATNKRKTVQERIAALMQAPRAVCESDDNLQAVLGVLRDVDEPIEMRMSAMQALQTASFNITAFESCSS